MATGTHDDGPSEFMFTLNKIHFSQIESSACSSPFSVNNIICRIVIKKIASKVVIGLGKYLGFFLSCKANNSQWSFPVRATLTIVSQRKGIPNFFRIIEDIFSTEENEFGFSDFMEWSDVTDPQRGFIVDDTVKFQAHILVDTPKTDYLCPSIRENDVAIEDESNSVFMFELIKHNCSSLSETWSRTCNIDNLTWQLHISKHIDRKTSNWEEYLSVYLHCEPVNYSELWCCTARVRLVLRSRREDVPDYSREFVQLFSSAAGACGYPDYLRWSEVMNPKKGYVIDDVIKIQVHINANAPQNVDCDPDNDKEYPQDPATWKALLEDDIKVKIVRRISEELKELSGTVELGQKNVVRALNNTLAKTLDSAIAPVLEKIDSLQETLDKLSLNQNTTLGSLEQRIASLLEKVEKISADNARNSIMAGKDAKNTKAASVSDEEPTLLSILNMLCELKSDMRKESFSVHRRRFLNGCMHNADDFRPCNSYSGFADHHPHLRLDGERDHLTYNRSSPWQECSTGRSTPCTHCNCYSTAHEQHSPRNHNPFHSSCISLPHLFQRTENDLERQKCDETESNFSGVSSCSNKSRVSKSENRIETESDFQSANSTELPKKSLLVDGIDADGEAIKASKRCTLKDFYNFQKTLEKLGVSETNKTSDSDII